MDRFSTFFWSISILIFFVTLQGNHNVHGLSLLTGCTNNENCTSLCGLQGTGECINNKYCRCSKCPLRSVYELLSPPKVCTYDPITCQCPWNEITSGRFYFGHTCLVDPLNLRLGTNCVCYCVPSTPGAIAGAIVDSFKCPFSMKDAFNNNSTTTASPVAT